MNDRTNPALASEERIELELLVERYRDLPEGPKDSIEHDLTRIESLTDLAYRRRHASPDLAEPEEERQLLDRAESLIPLLKVCMPGDR